MKEIETIIKAFDRANAEGRQTALATVVHVEGSSYRREGARMLITDEGQLTGAISGGCLEGDALRKALLVIREQKTRLVTYDTTDEDDAKFGVQLGCNGIVHVLIEPIDPACANNPVELFRTLLSRRQNGVIVTCFTLRMPLKDQPGTCLLLLENGISLSLVKDDLLVERMVVDAREGLKAKQSFIKQYELGEQPLTALVEYLVPAVSLVIVGAGNDAIPLYEMAQVLGWQVTVVDGRPSHATRQRFPGAHALVVAKPGQVLQQLEVDEQTVFVLMTHNYNYDLLLLKELLSLQLPFIGSLGPRKKLERMFGELAQQNCTIEPGKEAMVFGPVGLDIGAETAEEIALSILAEIKAVLAGRPGTSLRNRPVPIHSAPEQDLAAG